MKIHIVKQGDTLFELSNKYQVPLQKLIDANPQLSNPDVLIVGEKVKVPSTGVSVGGDHGIVYKHTVKQGDTLFKLSHAWGIPLQELIQSNPQLNNPDVLKVGEVINIPSQSHGPTYATGAEHHYYGGNHEKKNTAPIISTPVPSPLPALPPSLPPVQPYIPAPTPIITAPIAQQPSPNYNINVDYSEISIQQQQAQQQLPIYNYVPEYKEPEYLPQQPVLESPCGCSDHSGGAESLFLQYPTETQPVISPYNYNEGPSQEYASPIQNGYPGIAGQPGQEWPPVFQYPDNYESNYNPYSQPHQSYGYKGQENISGETNWPTPGGQQDYPQFSYPEHTQNIYGQIQGVPYQSYGQQQEYNPYAQQEYNPYGQHQNYSTFGYSVPGYNPQLNYSGYADQNVVPQSPIGGFGVSDILRENEEEENSNLGEHKEVKAKTKSPKSKAKAKVSGSPISKATEQNKLRNSMKDTKKTSNRSERKKVQHNPWIRE
ncbi:morphogenetic protein associated with SpoVID [Paenibacillus shirakamiensis]|uniref:Morphogenetic protein associated with SpoVID n=1 Tax=Paenibacillus shirakamiensis TaxID=1265935 RepID=A0ABS4JF92_9BACL|nr:morphogenetic protein associated with SpoVID [Paenibacillus shirakamiensis]